ncbi:RagB/SusD family nutrient uptake outer membrane protein [Rapidithrix thailandica]|uniref:RagB/SusD family nutrient uptake outer membrane protein n=1 Tax=Rapidithrix thailandica TaxID=413964 RepID=A0AAW9S1F4_9BACT
MNKKLSIFFLASLFLFASACNEDFLDKKPLAGFPEDDVWNDPTLTEAFLNDIYRGLGHGMYETMLASHTDETHFIHNYDTRQVVESILTPTDLGNFNGGRLPHFQWNDSYKRIRAANIFLEKIDETPFEEDLKKRMKGEAHFLRAYFYHNLVRLFGGVPIVTKVYELGDDFLVERNTLKECIDFIAVECEAAASLLPLRQEGANVGRANKGAAMALKARMLLYAASDLYHTTGWTSGFGNPELVGYVGADRNQLWRDAKDAAKAIIDLGAYDLYNRTPNSQEDAIQGYTDLFLSKQNEEVIFNRFFLEKRDDGYNFGKHNGPNGYHNWGGNTPLQNLIDDYEMEDGSLFDWDDPAHAAAPYKNRDPRFYASILYDGAKWRPRPSDVIDMDSEGIIQTGQYERKNSSGEIEVMEGLDTRKSPIEDWNGSYSGYYLRKFVDVNVDHQFFKQETPWPFFRYGEILLNYAEASIELGEEDDARMAINMIRERAGMPTISDTGADLKQRYRNERRVEMAFEEQRYFDARRWMIAPDVLSKDAQGIQIYAKLNGDNTHTYTYTPIVVQDRGWNDRMYLLPIPQGEMEKNNKLIQNPGY